MASLYGHKWTSAYGEEIDPDGAWRATLIGIPEELVRKGFSVLAKQGNEWPPSAPEFRKFCVGDQGEWQHRAVAAQDKLDAEQPKRLEQKLSDEQKDFGKSQIALMRESLKNSEYGIEKRKI